MFLFEGDGKAVLYTGDLRSEPWFVNALARNPTMLEYSAGIKTLDKIYLDTSFIEDVPFQTKAEGIAELLRKVSRYPPDTVFHFQAWTYGYEDVWLALSKALGSPIHVDDYKMRIYSSLTRGHPSDPFGAPAHLCPEAAALTGHMCGNASQPGCLTSRTDVRIHSCEKGNYCSVVQEGPVVWIQPIIAHMTGGVDRLEMGVGGGASDLEREAEIDSVSRDDVDQFLEIVGSSEDVPENVLDQIRSSLVGTSPSGRTVALDLDLSMLGEKLQLDIVAAGKAMMERSATLREHDSVDANPEGQMPKVIRFPYSRHSSYPELCHLVEMLKPKDVWPCTVQPTEWHAHRISIRSLFGKHCSGDSFAHDSEMDLWAAEHATEPQSKVALQASVVPGSGDAISQLEADVQVPEHVLSPGRGLLSSPLGSQSEPVGQRNGETHQESESGIVRFNLDDLDSQHSVVSIRSGPSQTSEDCSLERQDAYAVMIQNLHGGDWKPIALLSTTNHHTLPDRDAGELAKGHDLHTNRHSLNKRKAASTLDDHQPRRRSR